MTRHSFWVVSVGPRFAPCPRLLSAVHKLQNIVSFVSCSSWQRIIIALRPSLENEPAFSDHPPSQVASRSHKVDNNRNNKSRISKSEGSPRQSDWQLESKMMTHWIPYTVSVSVTHAFVDHKEFSLALVLVKELLHTWGTNSGPAVNSGVLFEIKQKKLL